MVIKLFINILLESRSNYQNSSHMCMICMQLTGIYKINKNNLYLYNYVCMHMDPQHFALCFLGFDHVNATFIYTCTTTVVLEKITVEYFHLKNCLW